MKIKQAIFVVKRNRMKFLGVVAFDAETTTALAAAKKAWDMPSQTFPVKVTYKEVSVTESWDLNLTEKFPVVVYPGP